MDKSRLSKSLYSKEGFTLIEILVVIAIIGIMSGIIMINVAGAGPSSRDSRRLADIKQIEAASEQYYAEIRKFPANLNILVDNDYLKEFPKDPKNTSPYIYTFVKYPTTCDNGVNGDCNEYCIYAKLEKNPGSGESFYRNSGSTSFYYLLCSAHSTLVKCALTAVTGICCGTTAWVKT